MTANGEVQTKDEVTVNVKELELIVTVMLLEDNTCSSFTQEALRRSWVYMHIIGPVVRNHNSSNIGER